MKEKLSNQGPTGSGHNSTIKNCEKNACGSYNNMGLEVTKLDFPKYNEMDDPTSWIRRVE